MSSENGKKYYTPVQMELHKSNLSNNGSVQAGDTKRFCRNSHKKKKKKKRVTSLITKEVGVLHEEDRNRTNWLVNLGLNS